MANLSRLANDLAHLDFTLGVGWGYIGALVAISQIHSVKQVIDFVRDHLMVKGNGGMCRF